MEWLSLRSCWKRGFSSRLHFSRELNYPFRSSCHPLCTSCHWVFSPLFLTNESNINYKLNERASYLNKLPIPNYMRLVEFSKCAQDNDDCNLELGKRADRMGFWRRGFSRHPIVGSPLDSGALEHAMCSPSKRIVCELNASFGVRRPVGLPLPCSRTTRQKDYDLSS